MDSVTANATDLHLKTQPVTLVWLNFVNSRASFTFTKSKLTSNSASAIALPYLTFGVDVTSRLNIQR